MSSATSLTVRCPACGAAVATGGLAPGSRVQCGACRRPLFLPMPAAATKPGTDSHRGPLPPHLLGQKAGASAMAPAPQAPTAPDPVAIVKISAESPPGTRSAAKHWIYDWLLLGGLALGALVAFAFVIGLISSGGIVASRQGDGEHVEQVVILEQAPQEEKWTDASERSQLVQNVAAKVQFFEYGPVLTRDERGQPKPADDQSYLQVTVELKNNTKQTLEYHSWYANQFDMDGQILEAELVDDRGIRYPRKVFENVDSLRGLTLHQTFEHTKAISDVIVFAVPENSDLKEAKYFRLKLPLAAVGKDDWFRLELPQSKLSL